MTNLAKRNHAPKEKPPASDNAGGYRTINQSSTTHTTTISQRAISANRLNGKHEKGYAERFSKKPIELQRANARNAWDDREAEKRKYKPQIGGLRISEMRRFFSHIYGGGKHWQFPCDQNQMSRIRAYASQLCLLGSKRPNGVLIELDQRLPWLAPAQIEAVVAAVQPTKHHSADELADCIGLDDATRSLLKIVTVGSVDVRRLDRAIRRKQRDAEYQQRRRAEHRNARSLENKPQLARWSPETGISRATFYRRQKIKRETSRLETPSVGTLTISNTVPTVRVSTLAPQAQAVTNIAFQSSKIVKSHAGRVRARPGCGATLKDQR